MATRGDSATRLPALICDLTIRIVVPDTKDRSSRRPI